MNRPNESMSILRLIVPVALFSLIATGVRADQVIPDDLIVQGSIGLGVDAVNNESFGADTLLLKEADLRLHFNDTSVGAFPTNDWRILINDLDSVPMAEDYFAIQDADGGTVPLRIDAGAPTDSIRLNGNGRIGLGTAVPTAALHVDVTFDDQDPTASVLIGPDTVTPAGALLQVHGPVYLSKDGPADLTLDPNSDTRLYVEGGAMFSRNIEVGSSRSLKEDIRDLTLPEAKETLAGLKAVEYRYIGEHEKQLGFIAEDVPDLVATDSRRSLSPMDFVAVLTKVVQDQETRLESLDDEFEELQMEVEDLLKKTQDAEMPAPGNANR
jgi:hypothetical protein